jgi:hypothetical protein
MAAGAGKVALVSGTASLGYNGGSTPCLSEQLARIVDLVGYGNANFFEGMGAAPTLNNSTAAFRAANGCTDTNNHIADFSAHTPAPRNTSSTLNPCPIEATAPQVANVFPTGAAADIATDPNIAVTFSEPVDVIGNWFGIDCTVSGAQTASVSGGPTTYNASGPRCDLSRTLRGDAGAPAADALRHRTLPIGALWSGRPLGGRSALPARQVSSSPQ